MAIEKELRLCWQPLMVSHITRVNEKEWPLIRYSKLLEDETLPKPIFCFQSLTHVIFFLFLILF